MLPPMTGHGGCADNDNALCYSAAKSLRYADIFLVVHLTAVCPDCMQMIRSPKTHPRRAGGYMMLVAMMVVAAVLR